MADPPDQMWLWCGGGGFLLFVKWFSTGFNETLIGVLNHTKPFGRKSWNQRVSATKFPPKNWNFDFFASKFFASFEFTISYAKNHLHGLLAGRHRS